MATKTSPLSGDEVTASGGPAWYEIRVAGVLDSQWAAWFDGLQVTPYVDTGRCQGKDRRCGARMAFSLRATGIKAARPVPKQDAA